MDEVFTVGAGVGESETDDGAGLERDGFVLEVVAQESEGGVGFGADAAVKYTSCKESTGLRKQ